MGAWARGRVGGWARGRVGAGAGWRGGGRAGAGGPGGRSVPAAGAENLCKMARRRRRKCSAHDLTITMERDNISPRTTR